MAGKNHSRLRALTRRFAGRRVGVLGDFMLDRFVRGRVTRISPEAPVPLVRVDPDGEEVRLGGAGNVVRNLAALGARPLAAGVVGADDTGRLLRQELKRVKGAADFLAVVRGRQTTLKTRIIAQHHHVVRVDWEETDPLPPRVLAGLAKAVHRALPRLDALVLSDYDKGVLNDDFLDELLVAASRSGVPVFLDLKIERRLSREIRLLQINKQRAEEITGRQIASGKDLALVGQALQARFPCEILALTLGSEGMRVFECGGQTYLAAVRDKPWEIFDVTGAGDTVLSALTLAITAGASASEAAELANTAAGVVVGKLGTAVCTRQELLDELRPRR